jgi:hypothetical protein
MTRAGLFFAAAAAIVSAGCARKPVVARTTESSTNSERHSALAAFARYESSRAPASEFLRLADNPEIQPRLRAGEIVANAERSSREAAPDAGMIQHWIGAAFVPGVTLAEALPVLQDYNNRVRYMSPEVLQSAQLSRRGRRFFGAPEAL